MTTVEVGQVWADRYPGSRGRLIRIVEVDDGHAPRYAQYKVVALADKATDPDGQLKAGYRDSRQHGPRRILLRTLTTGYRLVPEPVEGR